MYNVCRAFTLYNDSALPGNTEANQGEYVSFGYYDGISVSRNLFEDVNGKTNLSRDLVGGELLLISVFTLYANCKKGNRPSFIEAGKPDMAEKMYEYIISRCKEQVTVVEQGKFGADMKVSLVNDGPFTIVLDSEKL